MSEFLIDYDKAVELLLIDYPNLKGIIEQEQDHSPLTAQLLKDGGDYFINEIARAAGIFLGYVVPPHCLAEPLNVRSRTESEAEEELTPRAEI